MGKGGDNKKNLSVSHHAFEARWMELSACYLPVESPDSIWRFSRNTMDEDAKQGWKLHVSATILTANEVFEKVAPFLQSRKVMFKAPLSLQELSKLNGGIDYGYTQIGKFITVYPRNEAEAVYLAKRLHKLTKGIPAPSVPFDEKFSQDSCVHYRYGAFDNLEVKKPDGTIELMIRNPIGELVPDVREKAYPDWVKNPFVKCRPREKKNEVAKSPLQTNYRAFAALSRRGKGGVYKAIDFSSEPPRLCVLKEGRLNGETEWDGFDGRMFVKREYEALKALRESGINTPDVYDFFETDGNCYLVMEFIEGKGLIELLKRRQRRLSISNVLKYAIEISDLISQIHAAGWIWMDCKPENIFFTKDNRARPLDFEGAIKMNQTDFSPWCTDEFAPPKCRLGQYEQHNGSEDLYALGVLIYFLFIGRMPKDTSFVPMNKLRRNIPQSVCDIINNLLEEDPKQRPDAITVRQNLRGVLTSMAKKQ